MFKRICIGVLAALLLGYLVFAIVYLNPKAQGKEKCDHLLIEVVQNDEQGYLDPSQIEAFLKRANQYPVGKKMTGISTEAIEAALKENKLIKEAEAYKTVNGSVKLKVYQRTPVLRVISDRSNYYVDSKGEMMPVPAFFSAHVPVATGSISEEYARTQLYDFARFLQKNNYWNAQIEQICVSPNGDVELVPHKGNQVILLGKIENYKENLDKLELFYEKGLDKVGWNKYSVINLKFKNQVVCTKRN